MISLFNQYVCNSLYATGFLLKFSMFRVVSMDHIGSRPLQILWSRDRRRHDATPNGQGHDSKIFEAQYLENRARYGVGVNGPHI